MNFVNETLNVADRLLESAGRSNTVSAEWLNECHEARIIYNLHRVCNREFDKVDYWRAIKKLYPTYVTEAEDKYAQDRIDLALSHIQRADKLIDCLDWWIDWHSNRLK